MTLYVRNGIDKIWMQVKQQKKSSNKWSCVVCNQKQSVCKVFAQAPIAKDVRKFVQNFNMSRQLSDQKLSLSGELETSDSPKDEQKRKRNDWTEYVDQEDYCRKFNKDVDLAEGDDGLEAMVVTEMPKALFTKPKVKDYSSNRNDAVKLLKPQFPNRSNAKNVNSQEWTEVEQTSHEMNSKRNAYTIRANTHSSSHKEPVSLPLSGHASKSKGINGVGEERTVRLHHTKGPVSKWSSFITDEDEDDDDLASRGTRGSPSNNPLELLMNDQRVEDDIHPDFL
ncbi:hypothetical protein ACS0TY_013401 [Phlomoides rotata]